LILPLRPLPPPSDCSIAQTSAHPRIDSYSSSSSSSLPSRIHSFSDLLQLKWVTLLQLCQTRTSSVGTSPHSRSTSLARSQPCRRQSRRYLWRPSPDRTPIGPPGLHCLRMVSFCVLAHFDSFDFVSSPLSRGDSPATSAGSQLD
jgi:hypothetical protein